MASDKYGESAVSDVFGGHQLGIPYEPVADLLARYAARDPDKAAIVDVVAETAITFGALEELTTDIGVFLKSCGIRAGSRVLLLSDENLEKLLIWMAVWRIGAVVCPFNTEINEKQMVALAAALAPALVIYHKDIDVGAMTGDARAPRLRFGAWSPDGKADATDDFFSSVPRGQSPDAIPERNQ